MADSRPGTNRFEADEAGRAPDLPFTRTRRRVGTLGLLVVLCVASGTALGASLARPREAPFPLRPPDGAALTAVGHELFSDERAIAITPSWKPPIIARLPVASGVVTASTCVAGMTVLSGASIVAIDAHPIAQLATTEPFHRDLAIGASGSDVTALQSELVRLGASIQITGTYDEPTANAVRTLQSRESVENPEGAVHQAEFGWMPQPTMFVANCGVALGDRVDASTVLFTTASTLVGLTADVRASPPGDAGSQLLTVAGVVVPLPADGQVTDSAALAKLSSVLPVAAGNSSTVPLPPATVKSAAPIDATIVPGSAIAMIDDQHGCVATADRAAHSVRLLGSQLGKT